MSAQTGDYKNWLSRPDSAQQAPEPAPVKEPLPATTLKIAEGSDVREGAIRASMPKTVTKPLESYTPDGTYIPFSGGMRGWYENSGVPASESRNHYAFSNAVEGDAFTKNILERVAASDRRAAKRYEVELWAKHSDPNRPGDPPAERAFCTHLSVRGARLRVRRAFSVGQPVSVAFFREKSDTNAREPLTTVNAVVRHARPAGGSLDSPRYLIGVEFVDVPVESEQVIAGLIGGSLAVVPKD